MIDAQAFGAELAAIVKAATAPLTARIDALEKAAACPPEAGRDGKDADPDAVAAMVYDRVKADLGSQGDDPEVMTVDDIKALVDEAVAGAMKAIPIPKDGAPGPTGAPGAKGDPGRDGLDVKDLFRADGGRLVAVMSDGTTKDLGVFVGRDGKDGENGEPGSNGADGIGFDEVSLEIGADGRPVAKFQRGDIVKSVTLPCIIDRGVYRAGEAYVKGDAVSFGGSLWIAQKDTAEKPETGEGWRLAVKKGRDGKVA